MDKRMCSLNVEKATNFNTWSKYISGNFSAKEHIFKTFPNSGIWKYTTHLKPTGTRENYLILLYSVNSVF